MQMVAGLLLSLSAGSTLALSSDLLSCVLASASSGTKVVATRQVTCNQKCHNETQAANAKQLPRQRVGERDGGFSSSGVALRRIHQWTNGHAASLQADRTVTVLYPGSAPVILRLRTAVSWKACRLTGPLSSVGTKCDRLGPTT